MKRNRACARASLAQIVIAPTLVVPVLVLAIIPGATAWNDCGWYGTTPPLYQAESGGHPEGPLARWYVAVGESFDSFVAVALYDDLIAQLRNVYSCTSGGGGQWWSTAGAFTTLECARSGTEFAITGHWNHVPMNGRDGQCYIQNADCEVAVLVLKILLSPRFPLVMPSDVGTSPEASENWSRLVGAVGEAQEAWQAESPSGDETIVFLYGEGVMGISSCQHA